jgi:glycyl-tRNA synthetase beta chain
MERAELLLEIGTEEIPDSLLEATATELAMSLQEGLQSLRLESEPSAVWYTPRRLIVALRNIPIRQEDRIETVTGPPKRVAFDSEGAPTKAATAFAKKQGVDLSQLKISQTPKGEYISAVRQIRGELTSTLLQALLPKAIGNLQFPKTMFWTEDKFRFIRPLRWIVALFQGKVVKFTLADVTASHYTRGHRFTGREGLTVSSLQSLRDVLRENDVLPDPAERKQLVAAGLEREAAAAGGTVLSDADLLESVVNLNECPSVICGRFDEGFLALPQEILITCMREHQKYFSVVDGQNNLLPCFLAVINLPGDDSGRIRSGHERVLRARLADAQFFWKTDLQTELLRREEALRAVLFQEELGSYYDKTQRMLRLVPLTAEMVGSTDVLPDLQLACRLMKCDLVTEMVKEFTDLQGVVGGLYARAEGYADPIWRAVYEHYQPKTGTSPSPESRLGALLSLVDRIDTICSCFSVGLIPSGSKDPFGLRRQGNGFLKILLDHRMSVSLKNLISAGLAAHTKAAPNISSDVMQFLQGRLRHLCDEMSFSYDSVNAALAAGYDDPLDAVERIRALEDVRKEEDFLALSTSFKRIMNILEKSQAQASKPDPTLMTDGSERALWEAYVRNQPQVEALRANHSYGPALRILASMRGVVDDFFDDVLVMDKNPEVRTNRLALLQQIAGLFLKIADISQIVVERK